MAVSRTRRLAQGLALALLVALVIWHYLLRHYDLILPPALLAAALLVSIPLQRLGRLRQPLADYLLLIGICGLFAIEAPDMTYGMLWLGLPAVASFLLLSTPLALLLNLFAIPAWLALLGDTQITLVNLALGWWMAMTSATVIFMLSRRKRRRTSEPGVHRQSLDADELQHALALEVSRAHALARPLSVLVLYVPQLEHVNDQFGKRLRQTLSTAFNITVADNSRHNDLFGESQRHIFWLILPNTGERGAEAAGKRLSAAIGAIARPETGSLESINRICTLHSDDTAATFAQRLQFAADKLLESKV